MKFFALVFVLTVSSFVSTAQTINYYSIDDQPADSASSYYYVTYPMDGLNGSRANYTRTNAVYYTEILKVGAIGETERRYYYENGKLKATGGFYASDPVDVVMSYYPNGEPQGEFHFEKPKMVMETDPVISILSYRDSLGNFIVTKGNGICNCNLSPYNAKPVMENGEVKNNLKIGDWYGAGQDNTWSFKESYKEGVLERGIMNHLGSTFTYKMVRELPSYKGGIAGLYGYLSRNIKYPKSARRGGVEGTVYIGFVVDTDGEVITPHVVRGISRDCDAEALRVVSESPRWSSGKYRGKPVKVRFTLPVKFKLT